MSELGSHDGERPGRREVDWTERVQALIAAEPHPDVAGVVAGGTRRPSLHRLCRAAARALPATGVGISIMTDGGTQGMAAASDTTSSNLEELQFTLGEGPCMDAFSTRRPVLSPHFDAGVMARWPGYAPAARDLGVRAVFAFPLQIGAARLGVLDVYRDEPGLLQREALAKASAFTEAATMSLLQQQADGDHPADAVDDAFEHRAELYQAQGMVMVQLGVDLAEAMLRIRAYAFAHNRRLGDVARDILEHTLDLEPDTSPDGSSSPPGSAG